MLGIDNIVHHIVHHVVRYYKSNNAPSNRVSYTLRINIDII